jgi:hypothetical protein
MDKDIECADCHNTFVFTEREQEFYESKGFTDPKRCKPCRDKRKEQKNNRGNGNRRR